MFDSINIVHLNQKFQNHLRMHKTNLKFPELKFSQNLNFHLEFQNHSNDNFENE